MRRLLRTGFRLHRVSAVVLALCLVAAAGRATQDDPRLPDLFAELLEAKNPIDARMFEDAIWRVWLETGDRELNDLMQRGIQAMGNGRAAEAHKHYEEVIRRAPKYAEAWNKRATLFFLERNFEASLADIDKTLALEPRHFGALSGLGQIHDALEQPDEALEAYERALAIHPHLISVRQRVMQLREEFRQQQI